MKTLDIMECAEFLKIERTHALKLAGDGTLPGAKIGKSWVFLEEDLVEYLRQQVRLQQRQRAIGIDEPQPAAPTGIRPLARSPLAIKKPKRTLPDLGAYESPHLSGEVAAPKVGVPS